MTTSTTVRTDDLATGATPATAEVAATDPTDSRRTASRRAAGLAAALVALVAAVAVFGLTFPQLLAPAVAIAVLAVITALDWLLPTGGPRRTR
jgi:hypothetical protein